MGQRKRRSMFCSTVLPQRAIVSSSSLLFTPLELAYSNVGPVANTGTFTNASGEIKRKMKMEAQNSGWVLRPSKAGLELVKLFLVSH